MSPFEQEVIGLKFLHCADLHLDMPFSAAGFTAEKSSVRRQELKDTFQRIVELAKAEEVDALFISGDLYEHDYVRKSTLSFINEKIKEIPDIKVFIVPGNHDPFIENSFYKKYKWADNVIILAEDNSFTVLEDHKACIYGAGFKNFYEDRSLVYDFGAVNPEYINILLLHGTVDMNFKQNMYNPVSSSSLASLGMDYVALGHFHNRIDDLGGYGVIYNPGSPEPLGFDEPGEHGVFVGRVSKCGTGKKELQIRFVKTGARRYAKIEVPVNGCENNRQVTEKIREKAVCGDLPGSLLHIVLKGYTHRDYRIDIERVSANFRDMLFYLKIKDETMPDYDFEGIKAEYGLKGLFTRKMLAMLDKSGDEYEKKLLTKALYYGLEALEQGKVDIGDEL